MAYRWPSGNKGAKVAISECVRIDECQGWADKAEALASYARQAGDEELRNMADRIQARAIKRCGDLLKEIEKSKGGRPPKLGPPSGPNLASSQTREIDTGNFSKDPVSILGAPTRKEVARSAGLSEHQQKTAIRVSNIPDKEFEEAIESENPCVWYMILGHIPRQADLNAVFWR